MRGRLSALLIAAVFVLVGCGSHQQASATPEEVLSQAKHQLDQTSGVQFMLSTGQLPDGVTGVSEADGVLTRAPAFQGNITVPISGLTAKVAIIATEGKVWAKLPFTSSYQQVDPAKFDAPDPATLLDATTGISSLLTSTTGVVAGHQQRGGAGNRSILTQYKGTVAGAAVAHVIPSATGDFAATYTIDDAGVLSTAVLTGDFYGSNHSASTYTVTLSGYGTNQQISAP